MGFEYLWGILEAQGVPPVAEMFHLPKGQYKFYPFSHEGQILTFDEMIWNSGQQKKSQSIIWPSEKQIEDAVLSHNKNFKAILAFSDREYALTIKEGDTVKIHKIPEHLNDNFFNNFHQYGYDVVDIAGLSALTNIGYELNDLELFQAANVQVNRYGLIEESYEAIKISDIASQIAVEHAPFLPVQLWGENKLKELG